MVVHFDHQIVLYEVDKSHINLVYFYKVDMILLLYLTIQFTYMYSAPGQESKLFDFLLSLKYIYTYVMYDNEVRSG